MHLIDTQKESFKEQSFTHALHILLLKYLSKLKQQLKVKPYSIHGPFLKLEYLKTEFNEDSHTYAIVKVTSHSYRIMVNLSINDYFEVMRHP